MSEDLIAQYLAELRARLRTPPEKTTDILAEAEDHLRESMAAGLAAGMSEQEAQQAAVSAFGSVQTVARANRHPAGVLTPLGLAASKAFSFITFAVILVVLGSVTRLPRDQLPALTALPGALVVAVGYLAQAVRQHRANAA